MNVNLTFVVWVGFPMTLKPRQYETRDSLYLLFSIFTTKLEEKTNKLCYDCC